MEMWIQNNKLKISEKNMPEFKALIERAEKEAQQLQGTLKELSCFTIDIEFDTEMFKKG